MPNRRLQLCLIGLILTACGTTPSATSPGSEHASELYVPPQKDGQTYIATIAVDQYTKQAPLEAADGADRLAEILVSEFGFKSAGKLRDDDATSAGITDFIDTLKIGDEDTLILYYGGHGDFISPRKSPSGLRAGQLQVGSEGKLSTEILLAHANQIPAKHVLLLIDTCYSGLALNTTIERFNTLPNTDLHHRHRTSRRLITASGPAQDALDSSSNSAFSPLISTLIDGLQTGQADIYDDGDVTFAELGVYLQAEVGRRTKGRQVPEFGAFKSDQRGDPVIVHVRQPLSIDVLRERVHSADYFTLKTGAKRQIEFDKWINARFYIDRLIKAQKDAHALSRALVQESFNAEHAKEWPRAVDLLQESLKIRQQIYGQDHLGIARIHQRLADLSRERQADDADALQEIASRSWIRSFGADPSQAQRVAVALNAVAVGQYNHGEKDTAQVLWEQADAALDDRAAILKGTVKYYLAGLYREKKQFKREAQAAQAAVQLLNTDDPKTAPLHAQAQAQLKRAEALIKPEVVEVPPDTAVPDVEPVVEVPNPKEPLPETNSRPTMVLIPAGTFQMGSTDWTDSQPVHRVKISAFWMAESEVTQAQYTAVIGNNPSYFKDRPTHPVETLYWEDAVVYCNALSKREGLTPAYDVSTWTRIEGTSGYRLPTEAEWEYATRAGTTTRWWTGDDQASLTRAAYYGEGITGATHPVKKKAPNPWGLYDVHGNVWEWCEDWYETAYPTPSPALSVDPSGPSAGGGRVLRGGSYWRDAVNARSAYRHWRHPDFRFRYVGLRLVRPAPGL